MQITQFKISANSMLATLKKFKDHLDLCETEFEQAITNENQLSSMLYQYESQITEQFGDGFKVNNNPKDLMASARETVNKIQGSTDTNAHDQSSMVFD